MDDADASWLLQRARHVTPYITDPGARRIQDGEWVKIERPDGTAISVRQRELPDFERIAAGG